MEDFTLPDVSSYAAPLYVALILLEIVAILRWRAKGRYETRDALTSMSMGMGNVLSGLLVAGTVSAALTGLFVAVWQVRLFDLPISWWTFLIAFVAYDFVYYWSHRLQHRIRWGWASHVIHHSSQHFNLTTALRQPWFGFLAGTFVLALPLAWLGIHPALVAFSLSLNLLYQFWVHTEAVERCPAWFEAVMNTPSHHRVHHGKNPRYLDANYAGVFIVWDRLFGSFVPEADEEPVRYGLVRDIGTFNPLRVATHEYVAIARDVSRSGLTWRQRLAYLFAPPGWSHDGSRQTSRQIKEAAGLLPARSGPVRPARRAGETEPA